MAMVVLWFFWWLWYSHIGAHDGGGGYGCSTPMVMLRIVMVFWYCDERSRDGGGDNGFVTPMVVLNCSGGWRWFWYPSGCSGWWWWLWLWYPDGGAQDGDGGKRARDVTSAGSSENS